MILKVINWIALIVLGFPALYMFVFALCAKFFNPVNKLKGKRTRRFVVMIPAYKSDSCILSTALSARNQCYPINNFRVLVISDSMQQSTVELLRKNDIEVLEVNFEVSSKARSLQAAMDWLGDNAADIITIIDADNIVNEDYIASLDDCFENGAQAVQAHRTAKNVDTPIAVIDAAAEEINNSVFRKGHCVAGISSALIGSGMAFPYDWFRDRVHDFNTSGEDKEIELALLSDGLFVSYADNIPVLDEKTRTQDNYSNQHRRWIGSQYNIFGSALKGLTSAKLKTGYFDKLLQWTFPPRMIIMGVLPVAAILSSVLHLSNSLYWWVAVVLLVLSMLLGIPLSMLNSDLFKALLKVPALAGSAILNLFHLKGTKDNFIHTEHQ
ncbi:MAG: glycosyltransferase [Bacteroidaceae bacterium]|nr:glycosyltransferase [Bacteroidaceae bacterium]